MPFKFRTGVVVAMACLAMGCSPQNQNSAHKNTNAQSQAAGDQAMGMRGERQGRMGRGGLKRMCADEIQKYCTGDRGKVACLQGNSDKLSEACKTALNVAVQRRAARKAERNQRPSVSGQQGAQQPANNPPSDGDE